MPVSRNTTFTTTHHKASKPKNAVAINSEIVEAAKRNDVGALLLTIERHLPNMNIVNLATAIHRVAKLATNGQVGLTELPLVRRLFDTVLTEIDRANINQVKPQCVSNVLWALASMQLINGPIINLSMQIFAKTVSKFKPFEFATTLWALAKLKSFDHTKFPSMTSMFDAATEHLLRHAEQFEFRCLSMVAWSYATSQEYNTQLFVHLGNQLASKVSTGCGQELSLTAWAFGTAHVTHRPLFDALAVKALEQIHTFKPQELSNLIWGCASSGFFQPELFQAVLAAAKQKQMGSQHLANILWSFSSASIDPMATRNAHLVLLPFCIQQIHSFKSEEVSSVALSTAKAFGRDALRDRMKSGYQVPLSRDVSAGMPTLVVAFFRQLAQSVAEKVHTFPTRALVTVAETCSRLCSLPMDDEDSDFFLCLARELMRRMPTLHSELRVRIYHLFMFGEAAAAVPAMQHLIQQCYTKKRSESTSCMQQKMGKQSMTAVDTEICSDVGSVHSTDDPSSTEDQDSDVSWDSEVFSRCDSSLPQISAVSTCHSEKMSNLMSSCIVKNTFLHFNIDDCREERAGGGAQLRSCSAPVFRGRI